jgi:capsular polysaccharide biosynthesis protein
MTCLSGPSIQTTRTRSMVRNPGGLNGRWRPGPSLGTSLPATPSWARDPAGRVQSSALQTDAPQPGWGDPSARYPCSQVPAGLACRAPGLARTRLRPPLSLSCSLQWTVPTVSAPSLLIVPALISISSMVTAPMPKAVSLLRRIRAMPRIAFGLAVKVCSRPRTRTSTAKWIAAPERLWGTVQSTARDISGAPLELRRKPFIGIPGVHRVRDARVYGFSQPRVGLEEGPSRSAAHVLTRNFRPVLSITRRDPEATTLGRSAPRGRSPAKTVARAVLLATRPYAPDASGNYYHFWTDVIADLWFLRECGVPLDGDVRFLMSSGPQAWQAEILEMCGISRDRVIPLHSFDALRIGDLWAPIRPKGARIMPSWLPAALHATTGFVRPERPGWRRIYLSRQNAPRRRLLNEAQVIDFLVERGFEVHDSAGMSVAEQQALFSEAAFIVAPHGAGLTNLVWCPSNTKVIEILPIQHGASCFQDLCQAAGLQSWVVPCIQDLTASRPVVAPYRMDDFGWLAFLDELLDSASAIHQVQPVSDLRAELGGWAC